MNREKKIKMVMPTADDAFKAVALKLLNNVLSDIEYARKWRKPDWWLAMTIMNRCVSDAQLPKPLDERS